MVNSLQWLPGVLRAAGLKVVEYPGWRDRGRGPLNPKFIICHHTASNKKSGNAPSLKLVAEGRHDLAGPLSQLVLARDGTWHVTAAGKSNHAGAGFWKGVSSGNAWAIGIEAENDGIGEPWPEAQLDSYARGVAAILKKLDKDESWCCGHKEYALPKGRKIDPSFDMDAFRARVAKHLAD